MGEEPRKCFSDVRHFAELAAASKLSLMDDVKKDGFSKGFLGYQGYRDQLDKWVSFAPSLPPLPR